MNMLVLYEKKIIDKMKTLALQATKNCLMEEEQYERLPLRKKRLFTEEEEE